jgi:hypothetical protein
MSHTQCFPIIAIASVCSRRLIQPSEIPLTRPEELAKLGVLESRHETEALAGEQSQKAADEMQSSSRTGCRTPALLGKINSPSDGRQPRLSWPPRTLLPPRIAEPQSISPVKRDSAPERTVDDSQEALLFPGREWAVCTPLSIQNDHDKFERAVKPPIAKKNVARSTLLERVVAQSLKKTVRATGRLV